MFYEFESQPWSKDEKLLFAKRNELSLLTFCILEQREGCSELVVSIFDSYFGKYLRSFVLENDVSPSDRDTIVVALDQDTFIYSRLRANDDRIQYKILRLNRKYGD